MYRRTRCTAGKIASIARRVRPALLGSTLLFSATSVYAQDGASPPPPAPAASSEPSQDGDQTADIVVTALRRDTTLQTTPISISAVTGETLERSGVTDIHNLIQSTPSLSFVDAGPSQTRVIIRGIFSPGEPTIGLYYDETPVSGAVGSSSDAGASLPLLKLFDVSRVEALRGPQGTLYGSGSMGGTLRVIFNKPTSDYEAVVSGEMTTTDGGEIGYNAQAMVNVPVISDKLDVRAVVFDQRIGGYIDNSFLNQKNLNTSYSRGGRLLARFKPTDNLTVDGTVLYQHSYGQDNKWTFGAGDYVSTAQIQLPFNDKLAIYNLTARWDLGPVEVTAIASHMHRDVTSFAQDTSYFFGRDLNNPGVCSAFAGGGNPCTPAQQTNFNTYVQQFIPSGLIDFQKVSNPTAEVRVSSNRKGFLDWTIGGFYSDRTTNTFVPIVGADKNSGALDFGRVLYGRQIFDELKQLAGFGEGSAHLTSALTLTLGARYFHYDRTTGGSLPVGLNLVGGVVTPYAESSAAVSGWVTKANLAFQATDNLLFYASVSQGFRPGGVNQVISLPASLASYEPDKLLNYEVGMKASLFRHRLMFDIDGYLIDWSQIQVLGRGTGIAQNFQFITNAGAAIVKGIEANITAVPINHLTLQANATISSAELSENQANASLNGPGKKGDRIPYIPKLSFGASAEYNWALTDQLGGMARVDTNYVGDSYSEFNNTAGFQRKMPAYSLTNARVGIEGHEKEWGIYLFVNNVFNQVAITYAFSQALSGGKTLLTSAQPRTIGLHLQKNF